MVENGSGRPRCSRSFEVRRRLLKIGPQRLPESDHSGIGEKRGGHRTIRMKLDVAQDGAVAERRPGDCPGESDWVCPLGDGEGFNLAGRRHAKRNKIALNQVGLPRRAKFSWARSFGPDFQGQAGSALNLKKMAVGRAVVPSHLSHLSVERIVRLKCFFAKQLSQTARPWNPRTYGNPPCLGKTWICSRRFCCDQTRVLRQELRISVSRSIRAFRQISSALRTNHRDLGKFPTSFPAFSCPGTGSRSRSSA